MKKFSDFYLINGPNLNLLGSREPHLYGSTSLSEVEEDLQNLATSKGYTCSCFQSNHEGDIIDFLHQEYFQYLEACSNNVAIDHAPYIIINPGGLTHTSVALRDALIAINFSFIEVHISDIHQREPFRHHSFLSDIAKKVIIGQGIQGYFLAAEYIFQQLQKHG